MIGNVIWLDSATVTEYVFASPKVVGPAVDPRKINCMSCNDLVARVFFVNR